MTNTPALLSLLDAPWGSDPAFFIIWNRFRQLRRYLAYRPDDQHRIFRLLDYASAGAPGHGPIHLLIQSADELGFFWDSEQAGWIRPGLPPLRMMTGPIQHFRSAMWQAWQHKVATDLCKRKGFRGGFGVDIYGSHQLLVSSHFRETSAGAPGHGPIHLLIQSADELGFFWDSEQAGWIRPGLPPLRMMTGPIQHFRSAMWQAWQHKVATDLCKRKGFRGGFGVDIYGSHQLLVSSHFRERQNVASSHSFWRRL